MNRFRVLTLFIFSAILVAPSAIVAQTCPALSSGDLFKVPESSAVYLVNADMKRMYFPTSDVFHTWYEDFSGVQEISSACVDNYPAPSTAPFGVNYRPGSRLLKLQISPSVYAIAEANMKRKLGSESVARELYGDNWATLVRDVSDVFWPNYVATGPEISSAVPHDGMLVKTSGDAAIYYVSGGQRFPVPGTLSKAARDDVRALSASIANTVPVSSQTVTAASIVADPSGKTSPLPSSQPAPESTTPKPVSYTLEADDSGFYDNGADISSISAEKGAAVSITFNVRSTGVYYGGLDFRGCGQTTSTALPGGTTTMTFTADASCTITSYWPSSNVVKDTLGVNVL